MYMKKEDFYNTNKDINNLTTMLIDLLLKRLLEERYSEFYTESLSESKQYSPNTLLADKYLRFKSVIHQISFLLIFLDISLGVAAFCLDISSSLVSFCINCGFIVLLYLFIISSIDYNKEYHKINSFIISKNSDGSFVIVVLYRQKEQITIFRIDSIQKISIDNKSLIVKLKNYIVFSDDEKFNDNGTITLPAVYDDELIDDINKLKG